MDSFVPQFRWVSACLGVSYCCGLCICVLFRARLLPYAFYFHFFCHRFVCFGFVGVLHFAVLFACCFVLILLLCALSFHFCFCVLVCFGLARVSHPVLCSYGWFGSLLFCFAYVVSSLLLSLFVGVFFFRCSVHVLWVLC